MTHVALVTGGTRGIGEAISVELRDAGCRVAANYGGNDERAREFSERTGIATYRFDVGDFEAVKGRRRPDRGRSRPHRHPGQQRRHHPATAPCNRMEYESWDDVIRTNLSSCFNCCRAVIEGMRGRKFGRIVQYRLDQRTGRAVWPGQLRRRQVGHPRFHQGAGAGRRGPGHHGQRHRARLCRHRHGPRGAGTGIGTHRRAHPGRPAGGPRTTSPRGVLFLTSDDADFITGSTLSINGGQHMY